LNQNSVILRKARSDELDAVSLLIRDANRQYEQFFPAEGWKHYLGDMLDMRGRLYESQLIVAEADGKMAGSVTLYRDAVRSKPEGWPGE
jgi:hypothetical protein